MSNERLDQLALGYIFPPENILQAWDRSGHRRIALAFLRIVKNVIRKRSYAHARICRPPLRFNPSYAPASDGISLPMGIENSTSFVNKYYYACREQERRRVRGPLVVDGNNVMHLLRPLDWSNGGQYPEYRREVRKFYSVLQNSGITPIVIFDGAHNEEQKIDTRVQRRQDRINYINKQITSDASRPIKCDGHVLPILASEVYRMALHDLGIQFYVADGEADSIIARVANHYLCPVDSDFFIFRLVERQTVSLLE